MDDCNRASLPSSASPLFSTKYYTRARACLGLQITRRSRCRRQTQRRRERPEEEVQKTRHTRYPQQIPPNVVWSRGLARGPVSYPGDATSFLHSAGVWDFNQDSRTALYIGYTCEICITSLFLPFFELASRPADWQALVCCGGVLHRVVKDGIGWERSSTLALLIGRVAIGGRNGPVHHRTPLAAQ